MRLHCCGHLLFRRFEHFICISWVPLALYDCTHACHRNEQNVHNAYPSRTPHRTAVTFSYPPSLSPTSCFTESHRFPSPNESVGCFFFSVHRFFSLTYLVSTEISLLFFFGGHEQTHTRTRIYWQFSLVWCVRWMIRWVLSIFVNNNKIN